MDNGFSIQRLWSAAASGFAAGVAMFQSKYMGVEALDENDFASWDGRRMRYQVNWAMCENTSYDKMHKWAPAFKANYGLYRYIRNIYNPSYRLSEFYKSHLWGGRLDMAAGDGEGVQSALPITTDNPAIRAALADLWLWSNWQIKKDIVTLRGTAYGDTFIKIVDDPVAQKVYMRYQDPAMLQSLNTDAFGNVKAYTIVEVRADPDGKKATVIYREVCSRNGDLTTYKTYKDNDLYAWDGDGIAEWEEPYGFVPLVAIQHIDTGLSWGTSELHAGFSKFLEVDDLASKLSDQIRKQVDAPALLSGVSAPNKGKSVTISPEGRTIQNPESGREENPALYAPLGASYTPMVSNLSIGDSSNYIKDILKALEEEFPELSDNLHNVAGDISGRALRINREPVEDKIQERRSRYDDGLVRAQKMALTIGGLRGYDNFRSFNRNSFDDGNLEHSIADRPCFRKDPADDLAIEAQFWTVGNQAKTFGMPTAMWLKREGWDDKDIKEFLDSPEYQAKLAGLNAAANMMNGNGQPGPAMNRFGNNPPNQQPNQNNKQNQPPTKSAANADDIPEPYVK
jgi:hypothetical protein